MNKPEYGTRRCPAVSWDELADRDTNPVPEFLREDTYRYLGSDPLDVERYTSAEFFKLEIERMWPRVWQFAAREEDMPEPGSCVVYENAGRSFVLIRQQDGAIRAFHNVCLHRGRRLCDTSGTYSSLTCPYHAFSWNLDGTLRHIPNAWDFEHLEHQKMGLPEAQVGRWGGYVFVKEEDGGPSLEEFLAPLPQHFERWQPERCYTVNWAAKIVEANWKTCAEAFMEAMHVIGTHPQIMPFTGDCNTKYNLWGDHVNIAITPFGVTSPNLGAEDDHDEQWLIDKFLQYNGRVVEPGTTITLEEGQTARQAMGAHNRKRYGAMFGLDLGGVSDSEVQDAYTYNVFPNFSPWGGAGSQVVYRWRPWPDHEHTLMEVRLIQRAPAGEPVPPAQPMRMLGENETWDLVFGQLGVVLEQDMANIPYVQAGMRASKTGKLQLANYQEIRIRHFHQTLDKYLAKP